MRKAKRGRFVLVMVAISSLLLLMSAFGVLPRPVRGARRFQLDPSQTTGTVGPVPDPGSSEGVMTPGSSEDTETTGPTHPPSLQLEALPVTGNNPDMLPPGGESLREWPQDLSVPVLHAPDLQSYIGQATRPEPLRGITVVLDASHGGADTGAVWGSGNQAVMEKTLLLDMARETEKALAAYGATVVMTRTTDEEFSLFRTVALAADLALTRYGDAAVANGYERDLPDQLRLLMGDIIRINQNSPSSGGRGLFGSIGTPPQLRILYDIESQFSDLILINLSLAYDVNDPSRHGCEAYYMSSSFVSEVNNGYAEGQDAQTLAPNYTRIDSEGRARLASLLKASLVQMEPILRPEGQDLSGAEKDMAVLRLTNYVSVSVVPGYLSNASDRQVMTSEGGRRAIGQAIANGILHYYVTERP